MRCDASVIRYKVQHDQRPSRLRLRYDRCCAFTRYVAAVQENLGSLERKIGRPSRARMRPA